MKILQKLNLKKMENLIIIQVTLLLLIFIQNQI